MTHTKHSASVAKPEKPLKSHHWKTQPFIQITTFLQQDKKLSELSLPPLLFFYISAPSLKTNCASSSIDEFALSVAVKGLCARIPTPL